MAHGQAAGTQAAGKWTGEGAAVSAGTSDHRTGNARTDASPRPCRLMTFQKMTNDLIDFRRGMLTMDQLRERYPTWKVKPEEAKFCVQAAINTGRPKG